ncbi:hypothetical protein TNCV_1202311 [Trichonephila clavipes]|nr:hypothetical protein TNCV_1202311 [Trichonephila clavipes]
MVMVKGCHEFECSATEEPLCTVADGYVKSVEAQNTSVGVVENFGRTLTEFAEDLPLSISEDFLIYFFSFPSPNTSHTLAYVEKGGMGERME